MPSQGTSPETSPDFCNSLSRSPARCGLGVRRLSQVARLDRRGHMLSAHFLRHRGLTRCRTVVTPVSVVRLVKPPLRLRKALDFTLTASRVCGSRTRPSPFHSLRFPLHSILHCNREKGKTYFQVFPNRPFSGRTRNPAGPQFASGLNSRPASIPPRPQFRPGLKVNRPAVATGSRRVWESLAR